MAVSATGNQTRAGFVAESPIGTTPATPAFNLLPFSGFNPNRTVEVIRSNILGSRDPKHLGHGNVSVSGDVETPLIYGAVDPLLEAALGGTWTADTPAVGTAQLQNGDTRRGFTLFREQEDFAGADRFLYYEGCEINTLALSVQPNSDVTATFGVIGVESPESHAEITGATYVDYPTITPFRYHTGSIEVDSSVVADITGFDISVNNNIETSYVLFKKTTGAKPNGEFNVTGTLTVQFRDFALYDKFRTAAKASIVLNLTDSAGNALKVRLPSALFNSANADVGGPGEIPLSIEFECDKSTSDGFVMAVERTPV